MSDHNIFQRKLELKKHLESQDATRERESTTSEIIDFVDKFHPDLKETPFYQQLKIEDRPTTAEERLASGIPYVVDHMPTPEELIAWVDSKGNRAPVYVGDYYKDPETEIPKESDENDSQAVSLTDKGLDLKVGQVWMDRDNITWKLKSDSIEFIIGISKEKGSYVFDKITGQSDLGTVQLVSRCEEPVVDTLFAVGDIWKDNYNVVWEILALDAVGCIKAFNLEYGEAVFYSDGSKPSDRKLTEKLIAHTLAYTPEDLQDSLSKVKSKIRELEWQLVWERKYEAVLIDKTLNKS